MNTKQLILERLNDACRSLDLNDYGDIQWNDAQLLRKCAIRTERGDLSAWSEFFAHINSSRDLAYGFIRLFEKLGWAEYSIEKDCMELTLTQDFSQLDNETREALTAFLNPHVETEDESPKTKKLGVIMYIEEKPGLAGRARIGRVTFSATRKTIYYAGRKLQSLKGGGYKANFFNVETGFYYWISNCKKNGNDTLYPGIIEIDEDAREEYWTTIRKLPEKVHLTKFRSEGKYAKRRPT